MQLNIQVEKTSAIQRKLSIKVPAQVVAKRFEKGLIEVQKTAKLKGFRPGQAPISIIKQYYGEDVRHRLFHNLIDESLQEAIREHKIQTVGSPTIDTPDHKTGEGAHDHKLNEDQDLSFTATVEVMPEIEVKNYTGVAVTQTKVEITDKDVDAIVTRFMDSRAELVPASSGLTNADGSPSSRPVKKGDYVDMAFKGGIVTDKGVEEKAGMKGSRVIEVGSDTLVPGFEENLVDMRQGETKTFRLDFPKDFYEKDMAGKTAEFTATINEVKEKKLPELNDEFAKELGFESVADFRKKAEEQLTQERTEESNRKLRSDILGALIEKTAFDVPQALVQSQSRALAQDVAQNLKQQGFDDAAIQGMLTEELPNILKRAESQVRSSLILESIAKKEGIETSQADMDAELVKVAASMKVELEKLKEYYGKDVGRREDLAFRLRQERTLSFLVDKAKVKKEK